MGNRVNHYRREESMEEVVSRGGSHKKREGRGGGGRGPHWHRRRKPLCGLFLLIALWGCLGLYFLIGWARREKDELPGFRGEEILFRFKSVSTETRYSITNRSSVMAEGQSEEPRSIPRLRSRRSGRRSHRRVTSKTKATQEELDSIASTVPEREVLSKNSSFGWFVGPFGLIEEKVILPVDVTKGSGTCDGDGDFARLAQSRKFLLVFHELSMTGAPLSMMELATELLNCGATVTAVALSRKGGLMPELARRRITVLGHRSKLSFRVARNSDRVIAGSAVCASWIEQYTNYFPAGSGRIAWWIMENRREYFDRSKTVLARAKVLMFLSELQSKQWLAWCERENIRLMSPPMLVPLSVNDELAFAAGITCSLNTPTFTVERMMEKKKVLRGSVRKEMGLSDKDMLVISLSSINPGKGQFLLLDSARLVVENNTSGVNTRQPTMKILIGSVGSKSNKAPYVEGILRFISEHPGLSRSVLWTPATTRVASLYAAADVYVINSQGIGETFGRVTIEAMAYGLPVLGTNAGGTIEIIEHNKTGLLHPPGRSGTKALAENLQYLLRNPQARKQMGLRGREKVEMMYLKQHMYRKFAKVLSKRSRRQ